MVRRLPSIFLFSACQIECLIYLFCILGLLMSASSMLWIPGYAIYYLWTGEGTLAEVRLFANDCLASVKPKYYYTL